MGRELVPGEAFFTSPRPRRLCEDCGRRVTYGTLGDIADKVPADALLILADTAGAGGSVYWCSCGLVGVFSEPFAG